jgi:hypothetical protein
MTAPGKAKQEKGDAIHFGRALGADRRARKQGTPGSIFADIDRIAVAGTPARPIASFVRMRSPGASPGRLRL